MGSYASAFGQSQANGDPRWIFVGFGAMGRSLPAKASEASGPAGLSPGGIIAIDPDEQSRIRAIKMGARVAASFDEIPAMIRPNAVPVCTILWAVKPQVFPGAAQAYKRWVTPLREPHTILSVSIMAGINTQTLATALPKSRIVRSMPNTPAQIGQGVTAICRGPGATDIDMQTAKRLFEPTSPCIIEVLEPMMDAVTAISGSGPAYVMYLAQAMLDAALDMGLAHQEADAIVRQTILGAASWLKQSPNQSARELRSMVTSKGGTTEAACTHLDASRVDEFMRQAMTKARDRARELGKAADAMMKNTGESSQRL
jgi:pyrroline-5-carboxylate reductase